MLWHSFKLILKNKSVILFLTVIIFAIYVFSDTKCLFYKITGFPCPTCGMTRAIFAIFHCDIKSYVKYNIMAVPVALVLVCEFFSDIFGNKKTALNIFCAVILMFNFLYYLKRFIF